jgi:hypothetical protein
VFFNTGTYQDGSNGLVKKQNRMPGLLKKWRLLYLFFHQGYSSDKNSARIRAAFMSERHAETSQAGSEARQDVRNANAQANKRLVTV